LQGSFFSGGGHMYEALRVIREYDSIKRVFMGSQIRKAVIGRSCHRNRPLLAFTLQTDDDVFLEHFIILECLASGVKQVHVPDSCPFQDEITKWTVVGAVAEATR